MGAMLVTMEGVFSKCGSGDGKALNVKIDFFLGLETNKTKQTPSTTTTNLQNYADRCWAHIPSLES